MPRFLTFSFIAILLTACAPASPAIVPTLTPTNIQTVLPVVTPTMILLTPETRTATPESLAGEVLTPMDVKKVPVEVVTAMEGVILTDDDAMQWTYSEEYGMYGKIDAEGHLQYLVYPMSYSVNEKETKVNMPMKVSCTDGGAMCVMSGIAQGDGAHGAIELKGKDAAAREWIKWITENETWARQNPFLIDSLKKVAAGELDIEFVQADENMVPAEVRELVKRKNVAEQPKLFGQETGAMLWEDTGAIMQMYPAPFVRGDKLVVFVLRDVQYFANREDSRSPQAWDRTLTMALMEASFFDAKYKLDGQKAADLQELTAQKLAELMEVYTIDIE